VAVAVAVAVAVVAVVAVAVVVMAGWQGENNEPNRSSIEGVVMSSGVAMAVAAVAVGIE
jgi:hypothetical protein